MAVKKTTPVKKNKASKATSGKDKKVAVKTTSGKTIMSKANSANAKLEKQLGAVPDNWRSSKPKSKLTLRQKYEKQLLKKRGSIKSGQTGKRNPVN